MQLTATTSLATTPGYVATGTLAYPETWDAATATYNIKPSKNYTTFRYALSQAKAGVASCDVYFDGDSLTSDAGETGREIGAFSEQVRAMFQASGRWGTVYAGGCPTTAPDGPSGARDSRLTWDGSISGGAGFGGYGPANVSALGGNGGGTITYAGLTCDAFEVFDRIASLGSSAGWTWAIDGGAGTFQSQSGTATPPAQGSRKFTLNAGSYGTHTLTIAVPTGAYGVITGIIPRANTRPGGVYILRRGIGGSAANNWLTPLSLEAAYSIQRPKLVVLSLGTNPESASYTTTDVSPLWKTNMRSLIQAIKASGSDVLLVTAPPGGLGVNDPQVAYLAAIAPMAYQLADELDVGLMDWFWLWGGNARLVGTLSATYQTAGGQGHFGRAGNCDIAQALYAALCKIA